MAFGTTPVSTTVLAANQFPASSVYVQGTAGGNFTVLQGGPVSSADANNNVSAPAAIYVPDGNDVTLGTTTDASSANTLIGLTKAIKANTANVNQGGSWTVTANAGTNLNTSALALDTSVNGLIVAQGSTTSGEKGPLIQAAVTTSSPSYTTAQTSPLSLTTAGALRVDASATTQPVSGTVTANIGTTNGLALDSSVNGVIVAQGSTTSGEKGPMVQGAVTTSAPSYTTAQTSPLSLTTAGALRVDASATTQPVSGTITANIGTTNGLALDATVAKLNVAQAAALGSNTGPLMQGSVTTNAPSYTTGNINPLSLDTSGLLRVSLKDTPSNTNNLNVNLAASAATVTVTATNLQTNLNQVGGAAITLGSKTSANSLPVVIASDQGTVNVSQQAAGSASATLQSAQGGNANGTSLTVLGMAAVTFTVTVSTFTGTVNFEGSEDNSNWSALLCVQAGGTTTVTTTTGAGQYTASCAGLQSVRARTSGVTGGTVTVTGHAVPVSYGNVSAGAGGGSNASVGATGSAVPASGTYIAGNKAGNLTGVSLDASGNLNVNIAAGGGAGFSVVDEAAWTAGTSSFAPTGGVFNDSAAALTSGQQGTARVTNNRAVHVNLRDASANQLLGSKTSANSIPVVIASDQGSFTVTANIGTTNGLALDSSVNGLLLAQASTTSGQKGPLVMGAVTTNAPSYTTAQTDPLSLDTSGLLRVSIKDTPANTNNFNVAIAASSATVTVTGTVTANQGGSNWSTNVAQIGGTNIVTGGVAGLIAIAGPVASGSANADNPVKIGGVFNTTQPTVTNGQVVDLQATARGALIVATGVDTFTVAGTVTANQGGSNWSTNVAQFGGNNVATGTGAGGVGIPRVTASNDSQIQLWDGTRGPVAVKAANTPPVLADLAMVHVISPNNNGLPVNLASILQKRASASSGSVASLALAFSSNNVAGNSIIVVCGVGNGTAPTISDTASNTYTQAAQIANGTALNVAVFYAVNIAAGANTVTVNNGGTTASIVMEVYEVPGLIAQIPTQPDQTATNIGTSATASTGTISALTPNEYAFAAVGIGTAAQTITAGAGWTNDSGQQNPTTPAGLFSFISMSQFLGSLKAVTPQATFTSEPWAIAVASFRPVILGVEGTVKLTDGTVVMAFGQQTMANSLPVAIASNQSNVPSNVAQFGGTNVATGTGTGGAGIPRVTVSSDSTVGSNSATGAAVPANAFYQAGTATTALPAAATAGNLTGAMFDKFGRQIVVLETVRDLKNNIPALTLTTTTETSLIAAVASTFNDITGIVCINTSATATRVDFRDSTGGTIQFALYVPAGETRGFSSMVYKQTTVNTAWTAQLGTAVTDVRIYGTYLSNK